MQDAKGRLICAHRSGRLIVTKPIDGHPESGANGGTIEFTMCCRGRRLAKAGVDHGGKVIEDALGVRHGGAGLTYLAFLRDPDGNKLCALHMMPA